jgi:diguanylate cyclase (GGDEF)-like protein
MNSKTNYLFSLFFVVFPLASIYLTSKYNFLLFHSLAEIFSIVIAISIFIIAWNSKEYLGNNYLLFAGLGFLFIGTLDILHTLSYKGMGVFKDNDANLPTQLWIAARFLEASVLVCAPIFIKRKFNTFIYFGILMSVSASLLISIFYLKIFPDCYIEGKGLTEFKIISEYIISVILITAVILLILKRSYFDAHVLKLLIATIITAVASEFAFTLYISVYGLSNIAGHYFKILSFYFIYKAIIQTGYVKPFDLIFKRLKTKEEQLEKMYEEQKTLALYDPLTKLANRRLFEIAYDKYFANAKRYGTSLSMIMIDVDLFKQFNDTHGHLAGDSLLSTISSYISDTVRDSDIAIRYGGEEFLILLPQTDLSTALTIAHRIHEVINAETETTVSIGVSQYRNNIEDKKEPIARTDAALYNAKRNGRNRIESLA